MAIVKRLAKYVGLLLLAIVVVALFLPAKSTAQRSIEIAAPPATVYSLLEGFQRYNEFSPWFQYDPKAEYSWAGPATGVGASMSWKSAHPRVGNGSQEIIALEPNKSVTTRLKFDAPGKAQARWLLEPVASGTRVTWALDSDAGWNLLGRWFGVFLDRMMAADFDTGLLRLKAVAEADATKPG
jgi:ribosome-associated toxin RatA of RatAB toxin-antitoxin module